MWIPDLTTTRPPFSKDLTDFVGDDLNAAGLSSEDGASVLEYVGRLERGAPRERRSIVFEALRLKGAGKSYPQIADALCTCGKKHGRLGRAYDKRLDPCSDSYRALIREFSKVLKKYSR